MGEDVKVTIQNLTKNLHGFYGLFLFFFLNEHSVMYSHSKIRKYTLFNV